MKRPSDNESSPDNGGRIVMRPYAEPLVFRSLPSPKGKPALSVSLRLPALPE